MVHGSLPGSLVLGHHEPGFTVSGGNGVEVFNSGLDGAEGESGPEGDGCGLLVEVSPAVEPEAVELDVGGATAEKTGEGGEVVSGEVGDVLEIFF